MKADRIFLIGLMGSGKTYWGKRIAEVIGWRFIDLDRFIEEHEKLSIPEIFEKSGEDHFRNLESKYLKEVMSMNQVIVATGGGTPCFHGNMDLMNRSGETWYLKVNVETSAERLNNQTQDRPLLKGKNKDELITFFTKQLKEREPVYLQANRIVNADELDEKQMMELFNPRPTPHAPRPSQER